MHLDQSISESQEESETNLQTGLSDSAVKKLRSQYGYNEVPEAHTSALFLFFKKFWGLTAWMLEGTILISFLLQKTFDAWMITGLLVVNALIGFYNEQKAAKIVAELQKQLQVLVRVLRNGIWQQVPSKELVPGDIVRIRMGDFLTADMLLLEGEIKADKSTLTGETAPINNKANETLYAGSIVKGGEGTALVTATGTQSFFGKTARLVMIASHKMHMEEVVAKVVKLLFIAVISILALTTIIGIVNGQSFISILPLILILMVSAVPVGLPAMFTISMANGSKELAENGLLVSRLSATEDAATLTTLCIDKTGTITKNDLTLQEAKSCGQFKPDDVIRFGSMASIKADNDPIDFAFIEEAEKQQLVSEDFKQLSFTPFNAINKHTQAEILLGREKFKVAKGAFLAIKSLCDVSESALDSQVNAWAHKGFKTIAVAVSNSENKFQLVGIAALYDPPREDAAVIIAAIKDLGIQIKMLTGDALPIAREISQQIGVGNKIISINNVREQLKDTHESIGIIQDNNGFAEVLPEDKFDIVKTLQQGKEIVGMTGDGVNDAPALKQAEVGIAVKNATAIAKQAASIILLKEGLQQILELIKTGRSIHVRISNYTVNKIAKTIQTILFVCISYILTKEFVVAAFDMVLMLFLVDFVVLALAVDKVSWSNQPANWDIKPLVNKGLVIGLLLASECISWFFVAQILFDIQDPDMYHSLGFACLFFSTLASIPVIRTDKRFYKAPFSPTLLFVIFADVVIVCLILIFGWNDVSSLPIVSVVTTLAFFIMVNLIVNDSIKMWMNDMASKA